jgi:hypothetical protein
VLQILGNPTLQAVTFGALGLPTATGALSVAQAAHLKTLLPRQILPRPAIPAGRATHAGAAKQAPARPRRLARFSHCPAWTRRAPAPEDKGTHR